MYTICVCDHFMIRRPHHHRILARAIFNRIAARIEDGQLGVHAAGLSSMRVTLHESHVAWATYEGPLP